jgi:hypothetical protein
MHPETACPWQPSDRAIFIDTEVEIIAVDRDEAWVRFADRGTAVVRWERLKPRSRSYTVTITGHSSTERAIASAMAAHFGAGVIVNVVPA